MSEPCPFCHTIMTLVPETGHYKGYWKCAPCLVVVEFLGYRAQVIHISGTVRGDDYTVRIDSSKNETTITHWIMTDDGVGIGDTIFSVPQLLDITPSNIVEKIKLYLVFS